MKLFEGFKTFFWNEARRVSVSLLELLVFKSSRSERQLVVLFAFRFFDMVAEIPLLLLWHTVVATEDSEEHLELLEDDDESVEEGDGVTEDERLVETEGVAR